MDFRLGFGGSFGEETEIVVVDRAEPERAAPARRSPPSSTAGMAATLDALREGAAAAPRPRAWVEQLRAAEDEKRAAEQAELDDDRSPLHPMRLYKELGEVLDRDAIVIGDGGDFVSYAGRVIDSYEPGCWLDPGPFGCLGAGPGYALAAKLARPDRQVVLLLGDGAFGFSGMEFDTLARHGVNVVGVMGNNGIWALEKHPMEFLYGYSVAAELRPGTRYDQVVEALGGQGELVEQAAPTLKPGAGPRGRRSMQPVRRRSNVLTDAAFAYPRASRSSLARARKSTPPCRHRQRRDACEKRKPPQGEAFQGGPIRTGRGTCLEGAGCGSGGGRRRYDAASPEPMKPG